MFNDILRSVGRSVGSVLTRELRREVTTTARRTVRDAVHDNFFVYNDRDPARARTEFSRPLRARGATRISAAQDKENNNLQTLMVTVENQESYDAVTQYLARHAPNVRTKVTLMAPEEGVLAEPVEN